MSATPTIQNRQATTARWLLAPGIIWMCLFLVLPILMIVYVSFWTQTTFNISSDPTLASWKQFFSSDTYIGSLWTTLRSYDKEVQRGVLQNFNLAALAVTMAGVGYASVPLYRLFCQVTGFAGTPRIAEAASSEIAEGSIQIRFDANVADSPLQFRPLQVSQTVQIGQHGLLVVVAVGLLTLSTISLRSSTSQDAMATARANARLA